MKFKIEILVDGDPGVSDKYIGSYRGLFNVMTEKSFKTCEPYFPLFRDRKIKGLAVKVGSVTYLINRLPL